MEMEDPPRYRNGNSTIRGLCQGQWEFCLQCQMHSTALPRKAAALIEKKWSKMIKQQEPFPFSIWKKFNLLGCPVGNTGIQCSGVCYGTVLK